MPPGSPSDVVDGGELLARFILFSNRIRSDRSVKPDAFIPHPWPDLSVTRHIGLSEDELWETGQQSADSQSKPLYGRADVKASTIESQELRIVPTLTPRNHANVTGWPPDKPSQKIIAQEIAATAEFVENPTL